LPQLDQILRASFDKRRVSSSSYLRISDRNRVLVAHKITRRQLHIADVAYVDAGLAISIIATADDDPCNANDHVARATPGVCVSTACDDPRCGRSFLLRLFVSTVRWINAASAASGDWLDCVATQSQPVDPVATRSVLLHRAVDHRRLRFSFRDHCPSIDDLTAYVSRHIRAAARSLHAARFIQPSAFLRHVIPLLALHIADGPTDPRLSSLATTKLHCDARAVSAGRREAGSERSVRPSIDPPWPLLLIAGRRRLNADGVRSTSLRALGRLASEQSFSDHATATAVRLKAEPRNVVER
jgi:hypothetical protein